MDLLLSFAAGALAALGWVAYRSYRKARDADLSRNSALRASLGVVMGR